VTVRTYTDSSGVYVKVKDLVEYIEGGLKKTNIKDKYIEALLSDLKEIELSQLRKRAARW